LRPGDDGVEIAGEHFVGEVAVGVDHRGSMDEAGLRSKLVGFGLRGFGLGLRASGLGASGSTRIETVLQARSSGDPEAGLHG
jgi:hypothetical protein